VADPLIGSATGEPFTPACSERSSATRRPECGQRMPLADNTRRGDL